jgi:hypothetical protein
MKVTMPQAFACVVSITQACRDAGFQEAGFGWVSENGSLRVAVLMDAYVFFCCNQDKSTDFGHGRFAARSGLLVNRNTSNE